MNTFNFFLKTLCILLGVIVSQTSVAHAQNPWELKYDLIADSTKLRILYQQKEFTLGVDVTTLKSLLPAPTNEKKVISEEVGELITLSYGVNKFYFIDQNEYWMYGMRIKDTSFAVRIGQITVRVGDNVEVFRTTYPISWGSIYVYEGRRSFLLALSLGEIRFTIDAQGKILEIIYDAPFV